MLRSTSKFLSSASSLRRLVVVPAQSCNLAFAAAVAAAAPFPILAVRTGFGFGKAERGKVRLSFEEKQARRAGKTREQKKEHEARVMESEQYIDRELPDICEGEVEKVRAKAQHEVQRVMQPVTALFEMEVDVHGAMKPLSQLATIVKATPREYDIIPSSSAFTAPILQRLPRFEASLNPQRMDNTKIRVTIQPMTRRRREAVAHNLKALGTKSHKQWAILRRHAINHLEELGLNEDMMNVRKEEAEQIVKQHQEDLDKELEDLGQEVLNTSTNDEEEESENV